MKRVVLALLALLFLAGGACVFLLPEGLVVRGPVISQLLGRGIEAPEAETVEQRIRAAAGFSVVRFATGIPNARYMRFSPMGALLVSQPRQGQILHVLPDRDGDGFSDGQRVLLDGLDRPTGLDFHDGSLYVGEGSAVARVAYRESASEPIAVDGTLQRIIEGIPEGGNHWSRTLGFGPDGMLYLSVGSSCNVCEEEDPRRAAMLRFAPDGSRDEIYAQGLRNSQGFDWQPSTGDLYAVDNGRDLLGDDFPPCELNRVVQGGFYGWPYANGDNVPDPDFGSTRPEVVERSTPPAHNFRAHNAPLGIHFIRHSGADASIRNAALATLHGSWNRSELDGYKVVSLHWGADGEIAERDFLTGFEQDGDVIGRPVDIAEGPDGAIYVSDDYAGSIYQVTPSTEKPRVGAHTRSAPEPTLPKTGPGPLYSLDAETIDRLALHGAALFQANGCGSCHVASEAAPGVSVKKLEGLSNRYTLESLQDYFLLPQAPMPVFDLPLEDRRALAVHLLSAES